jgi:hypothetical protein
LTPDQALLLLRGVIMETAVIVLGIAAAGGVALAGIRLSGTPRPPTWLALVHGAIAATGLIILIYTALNTTMPTLALWALGIFVLAALGGAVLFLGFHLREKALPIPFVLGHGLIAATGYVLLLMGVYGRP